MQGLRLNNVLAYGGQVKVVGLDAVVAIFSRATLERRGENGSAQPIWTLHAVLSYQSELFLTNPSFTKRYVVEVWKDKHYEAVPEEGVEPRLEDGHLILEGVTLCPVDPKLVTPR